MAGQDSRVRHRPMSDDLHFPGTSRDESHDQNGNSVLTFAQLSKLIMKSLLPAHGLRSKRPSLLVRPHVPLMWWAVCHLPRVCSAFRAATSPLSILEKRKSIIWTFLKKFPWRVAGRKYFMEKVTTGRRQRPNAKGMWLLGASLFIIISKAFVHFNFCGELLLR